MESLQRFADRPNLENIISLDKYELRYFFNCENLGLNHGVVWEGSFKFDKSSARIFRFNHMVESSSHRFSYTCGEYITCYHLKWE